VTSSPPANPHKSTMKVNCVLNNSGNTLLHNYNSMSCGSPISVIVYKIILPKQDKMGKAQTKL
jgi:hypothetical protein